MVTVIFDKYDTPKDIIGKLDQYDYGQILRIQGLALPPVVEVHFAMQERGGDSVPRIGVTKDGVTDVPIPDNMLENNNAPQDYSIYAFVYITDATSGKTEYRIALSVRARPKPEVPGGTDNPDIFHEAVQAVREAAEQAAESEKQAEGWAHGREDLPERAKDNARYYAGQAQEDSRKTAEDRKEVERLVESVSGIDEQVAKVKELSKNAQEAATRAETSAEQGKIHKQAAENASTAAQTAAGKTAEDRAAVQKTKEAVEELSTQVQENKDSVDKTAQEFTLAAQQALADVNNAGQTQTDRVQTAGETAVRDIQTAQRTATGAVETAKTEAVKTIQAEGITQTGKVTAEGEKQVQAVQSAAQEIIAEREQIQMNKEGVAKLKEDIGNKAPAIIKKASGKTIIINDSSNLPIKALSGTGKIIITGKNILKTEKRNEFIPFEAKAGTLFTIITNGELSGGGNIKFIDENDEEIWFPINKGETKKSSTIKKNVKGYVNLLSPKEGLKYCLSTGENDEYKEYVEQMITAPVDSEQLKTIHTNYPTTVLTSENEISVEYVADTKHYIDKKFEELNQAIVNTQIALL